LSSTERAARLVKLLTSEEWRTLRGLELAALSQGHGDSGMISRLAGIPPERANFALDRLNKRGLVRGRGGSYALAYASIEALAMREYVRRGLISALGAIIAKGKESDVFEAFTDEGGLLALKFFKIGRVSFRGVTRKRFVERAEIRSWIAKNYEAAKREYTALRRLEDITGSVPRAVAHNRNTVLLEELSGVKLVERPELDDPSSILRRIIESLRIAYGEGGMINGDLSEYNILTDGSRVWLIDWPQAVPTTHPNSDELLRRDIETVLKFFKRVYHVDTDASRVTQYVLGRTPALELKRVGPSVPG